MVTLNPLCRLSRVCLFRNSLSGILKETFRQRGKLMRFPLQSNNFSILLSEALSNIMEHFKCALLMLSSRGVYEWMFTWTLPHDQWLVTNVHLHRALYVCTIELSKQIECISSLMKIRFNEIPKITYTRTRWKDWIHWRIEWR